MEKILTISLVFAGALIVAGAWLGRARRQMARKRNDDRMGQALRHGLATADGIETRPLQVVEWQACESTSARWS
jgi:hypothetical protein